MTEHPPPGWTLADLCAGGGGSWLYLLGESLVPPVSWMGGKRRLAREIHTRMGIPLGRPERIVLVELGTWSWIWTLILELERCRDVAAVLRSWEGLDPRMLWDQLAATPPIDHTPARAAQWLWLQARSASGVPVWWDGERHTSSHHGKGLTTAGQKGGGEWRMGEERSKAARGTRTLSQVGGGPDTRWTSGGIVHPATIADRIEAIARAVIETNTTVEVWCCDVRDATPIPGSFCYFDPDYVGCTGYECTCPRDEVLAVATRWAAEAEVVGVSEAVPLPLSGWSPVQLKHGKRNEWLTVSRETLGQLALWSEAL
jgi:hypothetical protein